MTHLDEQMHEVLSRQRDRAIAARYIDRRGWTDEQWADDAARLMYEEYGAITSLVNGHVLALLRLRAAILETETD